MSITIQNLEHPKKSKKVVKKAITTIFHVCYALEIAIKRVLRLVSAVLINFMRLGIDLHEYRCFGVF
mgnify:CR=1 FL=1